MDNTNDSDRDREGITACSTLIRQAVAQMLEMGDLEQPFSLSEIRPCIEKESLRGIGIDASDSVLEMMTRSPRAQLPALLKYRQQTADIGAQTHDALRPDAVAAELVDVFADALGRAYWAARNCTQPAKFEALLFEQLSSAFSTLHEPIVEHAITPERLMAIDLSKYDDLVTYPAGRDWPLERKKILFLQTAVRLDVDWADLLKVTCSFFGETLVPPFEPVVVTLNPMAFEPPPFDVARQMPGDWAVLADRAWSEYRKNTLREISDWRNGLIEQGTLKEFERRRKNSGIQSGLKKVPIADEKVAFEWAVVAYFSTPIYWASVARVFLDARIHTKGSQEVSRQVKRLADQIRKRVVPILTELGLPRRMRK